MKFNYSYLPPEINTQGNKQNYYAAMLGVLVFNRLSLAYGEMGEFNTL